jgi:hypothetical protein
MSIVFRAWCRLQCGDLTGYEAELIGAAVLVMENFEKQPLLKTDKAGRKLDYF